MLFSSKPAHLSQKYQMPRYSFWVSLISSVSTFMLLSFLLATALSISSGTLSGAQGRLPRFFARYSAYSAWIAKLMSMISAGCPSPAARLTSLPSAMTKMVRPFGSS